MKISRKEKSNCLLKSDTKVCSPRLCKAELLRKSLEPKKAYYQRLSIYWQEIV